MSTAASVTVYSTTWCGFCKMVKQYLETKKVAFKEIDVEQDRQAGDYIIKKTNQMGVPVTEIGDYTIIGFDKAKIDAALKELKLI